jgi:hypothetical protein
VNRRIKLGITFGVAVAAGLLVAIPRKAASFDTRMTVATTLFAAVAAVAGVLALWYASTTVRDAKTAAQEARDQHREQIETLNAATASQVAELRRATEESAQQHRVEMTDRRSLGDAEKFERRMRQIADTINHVVELGNVARDVAHNNNEEAGRMTAASASIPSMVIAVDGGLNVLTSLGIATPPELTEIVKACRQAGVSASEVATRSVDALLQLERLASELMIVRMQMIARETPQPS